MKRYLFMIMTLLCVITFMSCGKADDEFNLETDFQYQNTVSGLKCRCISQDEEGNVYFISNHFIYKYDRRTKQAYPLCNRPNCLHDKETEYKKFKECNAFMNESNWNVNESGIQYYNGKIYAVQGIFVHTKKEHYNVFSVNVDGSHREDISDLYSTSMLWCIHRGKLYFVQQSYDSSNKESYLLMSLGLDSSHKLKKIYDFSQTFNISGFPNIGLTAYKNRVYIPISYFVLDSKNQQNTTIYREKDIGNHLFNNIPCDRNKYSYEAFSIL